MTIDWWGLGLQAVNVLILVWLLSRVFWRPVAGAIARRRDAAQGMLDAAKAARAKSDAAFAEVTIAREGIAAERDAILAAATEAAEAETESALDEAHDKAEKLVAAAQLASDRVLVAARKETAAQSAQLAVEIAEKLLGRLNAPAVETAFIASLVGAIAQMSPDDRAALTGTATGIDLVSATDLDDSNKTKITNAIGKALGGTPKLTFVTDPELIAGLELRTAHFVLHNSWRSDLEKILEELKNAD